MQVMDAEPAACVHKSFTGTACREEESGLQITDHRLQVYPNPAHGNLTVSIDAKKQSNLTLLLTDITRRMMISEIQPATEGLNIYELDLNHLSKGVYMLTVQSANENWKTKVVIE